MVFRDPSEFGEEDTEDARARLKFCEPEVRISELHGVLDLRTELSAQTGSSSDEPDLSLVPLALAIPDAVQVKIQGEDRPKWRILPGAPIAFATGQPNWYSDTSDFRAWCRMHGDFTEAVREEVGEYFRVDTQPRVGGFISFPLVWDQNDADEEPLGILNIHRELPGLFKNDGDPVRHFVAISWPLRVILMQLVSELLDRELLRRSTSIDGKDGSVVEAYKVISGSGVGDSSPLAETPE
jgi:hypothetical protein